MNKIIQAKLKNSKIIFIAVICILIIGIAGLLIFNATDNSSAKLDNKGNIASKISNNVKEKNQMIQSIQAKKAMMKRKITAKKVQRVMLKQTTRLKRTILIVQINQIPLINRIVLVQTVQIV